MAKPDIGVKITLAGNRTSRWSRDGQRITSLERFRTISFDRAIMAQSISIDAVNSSIAAGAWFAVVPECYRPRAAELVADVFAEHRGNHLTDASLERFVSDLHERCWDEMFPISPAHVSSEFSPCTEPFIAAAVHAIMAVKVCRVISNPSEFGVVRVAINDIERDEEPNESLRRMVLATVKASVAAGMRSLVDYGPVWRVDGDKHQIPVGALSDEQLDDISVENDRREQSHDTDHDPTVWAVWIEAERRRRRIYPSANSSTAS